jgi:hypothetical protein
MCICGLDALRVVIFEPMQPDRRIEDPHACAFGWHVVLSPEGVVIGQSVLASKHWYWALVIMPFELY